jgi:hypothetical protein
MQSATIALDRLEIRGQSPIPQLRFGERGPRGLVRHTVFAFPLLSPELIVGEGKKKSVRPFGRWFDYPVWLGAVAAAGALVLWAPAWLYYPLAIFLIAGLVGIFFNLSLVIWEMALERAGRWGKRPWTFIPAALTVALVFALLNVFHYYSFKAVANISGGELPQ